MCLSRSASEQRMEAERNAKGGTSMEQKAMMQQYQNFSENTDDLKKAMKKEDLSDLLAADPEEVCICARGQRRRKIGGGTMMPSRRPALSPSPRGFFFHFQTCRLADEFAMRLHYGRMRRRICNGASLG